MALNDVLKWSATFILIVGQLVNSAGFYPQGPLLLISGGSIWLIVAIRWREPALIVTNSLMTLAAVGGLLFAYLG